jgi:hypothetical protein
MHLKIDVLRPNQAADDIVGGSVQTYTTVMSGIPGRIGTPRTPKTLRAQGIEIDDQYDLELQSWNNQYDVRVNDYVRPQNGQYAGQDFLVLAVQDDPVGDNPNDRRNHKYLQVKRVRRARTVQ